MLNNCSIRPPDWSAATRPRKPWQIQAGKFQSRPECPLPRRPSFELLFLIPYIDKRGNECRVAPKKQLWCRFLAHIVFGSSRGEEAPNSSAATTCDKIEGSSLFTVERLEAET